MARPRKKTLDFFVHDATARCDRKIRGLRRKHGNDGYATYFVLLEMLCQEDGMKLSLADQLDVDTAVEETGTRDDAHLYAIIQTCVEIGLLDRQMWEAERIIFSGGLYRRYLTRLQEREADAKRKRQKREAELLAERIAEVQGQNSKAKEEPDLRTQIQNQNSPELSASYPTGKPHETEGENETASPSNLQPEINSPSLAVNQSLPQQVNPGYELKYSAAARCDSIFAPKPWRDTRGAVSPEFCEFVGKQLPSDGQMHPKTKGRNHIINLERGGDLEKLDGYWLDYQEASCSAPPAANRDVDAIAKAAIRGERLGGAA